MKKNYLAQFTNKLRSISKPIDFSNEIGSSNPTNFEEGNQIFDFKYIEELPNNIVHNIIYIVGEKNYYWMAAFICPCGCDAIIKLNLLKRTYPSWRVSIKRGRITIKPSIRRIVGCRKHFLILRGRPFYI
jgi:hypothetical protein